VADVLAAAVEDVGATGATPGEVPVASDGGPVAA